MADVEPAGPLRCVAATIDITPSTPTALAGYENRKQAWRSISSRLEANALMLEEGGRRTLFIAADLLYFGGSLTASITRRTAAAGIPEDRVILTASHTHFAPASDPALTRVGAVDAAYAQWLETRMLALVERVLSAEPQPVTIHLARDPSNHNINRRKPWPWPTLTRNGLSLRPKVVMAPTPDGPRDDSLDALTVTGERGDVVAVIWKYACHPVGLPDTLDVSSEFPGHARARLREHLGDAIPVVFWQGFAGDIRPRLNGRPSWKSRLQALRRGPGFYAVTMEAWRGWADKLGAALVRAVTSQDASPVSGPIRSNAVKVPLAKLLAGSAPQGRAMSIQRIEFGQGPAATFFAAEVCSPYLASLGPGDRNIGVGYVGDVFGYLPSEQQVREGGYEGGGFFPLFGLEGGFRPGFADEVLAALEALRSKERADA